MKFEHMAMILILGLAAPTLPAQQSMPDMPGMKMDVPKSSPQQSSPPAPKPNRTRSPNDPMPPDTNGMAHDAADARAKEAAASVKDSVQQQAGQAQTKPGADSDAGSLKLPIQELQEPEAIGFQTGTDLPAPDLLRSIVNQQPSDGRRLYRPCRSHESGARRGAAERRSLPAAGSPGQPAPRVRSSATPATIFAAVSMAAASRARSSHRRSCLRISSLSVAMCTAPKARSNEFAAEIQRARVLNDVGRAFFNALAAQESVVVQDRLLKVALDAETNAHERERVGQADASDVLNAEIAAEQAEADFETTQRMFLGDFAQLATYAGLVSLSPHPLAGGLVEPPKLDAEAMVANAIQDSPAVKQAQANVAVAEARVKSANRERVPDLNLKAGEWYSGERLGATNIKAGPEAFVEAGVQLPFWNRNQGNIGASRVELERARQAVIRIQLITRNRAEPIAQQYQAARSTAERYRTEMLPRARRAYQLEVTKYQQMAQTYPHVLTAQHMLFMLQLSYIRALNEEWRAAISLQNYTLMNALDEAPSVGQDSTTMNLPTAPGGDN